MRSNHTQQLQIMLSECPRVLSLHTETLGLYYLMTVIWGTWFGRFPKCEVIIKWCKTFNKCYTFVEHQVPYFSHFCFSTTWGKLWDNLEVHVDIWGQPWVSFCRKHPSYSAIRIWALIQPGWLTSTPGTLLSASPALRLPSGYHAQRFSNEGVGNQTGPHICVANTLFPAWGRWCLESG